MLLRRTDPHHELSSSGSFPSGHTLVLLVCLGVALLLAFLDRSVKSLEDAQAAAQVPVLGIIPILAESELPANDVKARDLYVHQNPSSHVSECCRSLRTTAC